MRRTTGDVVEDFLLFAQRQYDCLDYDPFHPVMNYLEQDMPPWRALWASTYYMAFYNPASAMLALEHSKLTPHVAELPAWARHLPIGLQRRNLRGGLVVDYFGRMTRRLAKHDCTLYEYLARDFTGDERADWHRLQDTLCTFWGNGRWSAYTLGELYQKVNHLPVWPDTIGNDGSSGPRVGIQAVMGKAKAAGKEALPELDAKADRLFAIAEKRLTIDIPYLPPGHFDYAMLESELCDFQSLQKGRYYIGRDVDRMQERILRAQEVAVEVNIPGRHDVVDRIWAARRATIEPHYLGEVQGWQGRTRRANQFYRDAGYIASQYEIRSQQGGLAL